MKIVSISSVYPNPGEPGLGPFVRWRLHHLAKFADVTVLAPVPAIDYSHPKRDALHGWRIQERRSDLGIQVLHPRWLYPPGGTPLNVLCMASRLFWTLLRLRSRFRFEWIDAHFGYPEGVAAAVLAAIFGCPFSITLRGSELAFASSPFRLGCMRWALKRASAVFAVSGELTRFAIACGADPRRVHTSPNGIDAEIFHPADRARLRTEFGMSPGRKVVVTAGELIEAKGHHLVIQALRDLNAQGIDCELFIAGALARGGAPFEGEIRRVVSECALEGRVHFTGWVKRDRLAHLMCAADVFCLASFIEGWPNVVNEALACGTPVVATAVGAVPEMLPDESYGFVVPPRETAPLTVALRRALTQTWDRDKIAVWGHSRSWEDVAHEVAVTIERELARSQSVSREAPAGPETA